MYIDYHKTIVCKCGLQAKLVFLNKCHTYQLEIPYIDILFSTTQRALASVINKACTFVCFKSIQYIFIIWYCTVLVWRHLQLQKSILPRCYFRPTFLSRSRLFLPNSFIRVVIQFRLKIANRNRIFEDVVMVAHAGFHGKHACIQIGYFGAKQLLSNWLKMHLHLDRLSSP